ncbi:hypothetical protein PINS_up015393 [Pythium insidiosum]|nr:hypothetical protein PINS_up015393 [Pythium insidiosum]
MDDARFDAIESDKRRAHAYQRPQQLWQRRFDYGACPSRHRLLTVSLLVFVGFLLGFYAQVAVFFLHVRVGFTGSILPTTETSLSAKFTQSLIENTRRIMYVCKKTNWDYVGLVATPHMALFAHEDVQIPPVLDRTLSVIRHQGVDSYMNLHNKTLTLLNHVHASGAHWHLFKQDDEAVIFWPHYYQCLSQCKNLATCYAGDMHVNIGDATNSNSYVFATGGSYFLGNELVKCLVEHPAYVRVDGLDFGEDKTVGKMLHYNKCGAEVVSCKWFNNREVYSPNVVVRMVKRPVDSYLTPDAVLTSEAEVAGGTQAPEYDPLRIIHTQQP